MIETLSSSLALYKINRDRWHYEAQRQKRKALILMCLINLCIVVALMLWIVYR